MGAGHSVIGSGHVTGALHQSQHQLVVGTWFEGTWNHYIREAGIFNGSAARSSVM